MDIHYPFVFWITYFQMYKIWHLLEINERMVNIFFILNGDVFDFKVRLSSGIHWASLGVFSFVWALEKKNIKSYWI